jgi:hypothetical protein
MVSTASEYWARIFSDPLQFAIALYIAAGMLVALFIAFRGMKLREPPNDGRLWEKKDNARNILFLFQSILLLSPIAFIIEVALWPLVLLFLWAFQEDEEDDDDQTI